MVLTDDQVYAAYKELKEKKKDFSRDTYYSRFTTNIGIELPAFTKSIFTDSYIPAPIKIFGIPKKDGNERIVGAHDFKFSLAQQVVKNIIEPDLEKIFVNESFGFRKGRFNDQAIYQCQQNCAVDPWVIDVDIRKYFDSINRNKLNQVVASYFKDEQIQSFVAKFLQTPYQLAGGQIKESSIGIPTGGILSPLLSNLYLHEAFDRWMKATHPENRFVRFADDVVIHSNDRIGAGHLLLNLKDRLAEFDLQLHPEKTKILAVSQGFDFLGHQVIAKDGKVYAAKPKPQEQEMSFGLFQNMKM